MAIHFSRHFRRLQQLAPLLLAMGATACSGDTTPATAPDIKFESTTMTIKGKPYTIEIADTTEKTERGLMFRSSMPADHGMLFVFDHPDTIAFWMKNTLIPLDIIFLNPYGKVLEIHRRRALDETSQGPNQPAQFVIELNAGTADAIGLKPGDTITLPGKYLKTDPTSPEKKP